jgi:hypothetical protein
MSRGIVVQDIPHVWQAASANRQRDDRAHADYRAG